MNYVIDKELVGHLVELSRLTIGDAGEKLLKDMQAVVAYFDTLRAVRTGVQHPVLNTQSLKNVIREDAYDKTLCLPREGAREAFPYEQNGYLKVPKIL